MSNYFSSAINPNTKKLEHCAMLDDCFGKHKYGVLFKDGGLWKQCELSDYEPNPDDFDELKAYRQAADIMANKRKLK